MSSEFASANLTVGQINAIVKKLGGEDGAMKFLRGELIVQLVKHVIDCDAAPFCPEGWKVESHKKGGQLEWSAEKISLYLSAGQKNGKWIVGNELRKELENQSVLNANVLDYLLAHPELIPEEWKSKAVFFWGTIYCNADGSLYVRCLYWSGELWDWDYGWLGDKFDDDDPAACSQVSS